MRKCETFFWVFLKKAHENFCENKFCDAKTIFVSQKIAKMRRNAKHNIIINSEKFK